MLALNSLGCSNNTRDFLTLSQIQPLHGLELLGRSCLPS